MLRLQSISLTQFKNYDSRTFQFHERIIGIYGDNGVGKTNLLDSIHYLCFTKSYFARDHFNVQKGKEGFRIEGTLELNGVLENAVCIFRETGKKEFSINETCYEKFAHHIGHYPCVIIAPDDIQIITGSTGERRRLVDSLLSQIDPEYLQQLITYNKVLLQRNSLLKSFADSGKRDFSLLDILDEQLMKPAEIIFQKRKEFLVTYLPVVKNIYAEIAKKEEEVFFEYQSELLQSTFKELLHFYRNRDLATQRTAAGIHRDELLFNLTGQPFRNIASQGQRKSLLFALKLGEMEVLTKTKGFAPILLLDDVFEKLDEGRIASLLKKVCLENKGQVFITDTNEERLTNHLNQLQVNSEYFSL